MSIKAVRELFGERFIREGILACDTPSMLSHAIAFNNTWH